MQIPGKGSPGLHHVHKSAAKNQLPGLEPKSQVTYLGTGFVKLPQNLNVQLGSEQRTQNETEGEPCLASSTGGGWGQEDRWEAPRVPARLSQGGQSTMGLEWHPSGHLGEG